MLIPVPFYVQEPFECGPVALQMVLEHFGKKCSKEEIKALTESESSGATHTIALAKAAAQLGFPVEFYSVKLGFNPKNFELQYYQKLTDGPETVEEKLNALHTDCVKYGVRMEERSLPLEEILSKLSDSCVAIVLIDWSKFNNTDTFIGHICPLIGYDEKNVYIHQPGPQDPAANFAVKKDLFESARKATGTDEDVVFIWRAKAL